MIIEFLATTAFATLSFASLSGTNESRTVQKDVIVQALRTAFPEPSAFIEESSEMSLDFEKDVQHPRLKVFCVRCFQTDQSQTVDARSVVYSSVSGVRPSGDQIEISFTTGVPEQTEETKSWSIRIELDMVRFAAFSTTAIDKGQAITSSLVSIRACLSAGVCRSSDAHPTYADAVEQVSGLMGHVARRPISPGQQITAEGFVRPTTVRKGSMVSLTLTTANGLTIKTQASALADGRSGDTIPVSVEGQTKRTVRARVLDSREVEYAQ